MISDDDPRWASALGGYRLPYDSRPALKRLCANGADSEAWEELWNELHHQGDIGEASYLALAALARIRRSRPLAANHLYGLAATIEVERHRQSNPPVPDWLREDYRAAREELVGFALEELKIGSDGGTLQQALALVALGRGLVKLGAMISHQGDGTLEEYLDEHLAWAELYRDTAR